MDNDKIISSIYDQMHNTNFNALGMLDSDGLIHTFGTDSKIIGRLFEMFTEPVLERVAKQLGYKISTPEKQTVYPDFIFSKENEPHKKIAIDVKTTYIENENSAIKFTLGSYASYMRNNTKNIAYPYTDFISHYVIGFVYKRNDKAQESLCFKYSGRDKIVTPYCNLKYFVQEKYKIAGDKPGSGNTENIGSFSTKDFSALQAGKGPFAKLGPEIFDLYWKYYPKYRSNSPKTYTSLPEFISWLPHQTNLKLLYPFDMSKLLKRFR